MLIRGGDAYNFSLSTSEYVVKIPCKSILEHCWKQFKCTSMNIKNVVLLITSENNVRFENLIPRYERGAGVCIESIGPILSEKVRQRFGALVKLKKIEHK